MPEDEPFIRAILATPDDRTVRLVYADWLDDRGDPRAEYLRLQSRIVGMLPGSDERRAAREQLTALQHGFPSWWLAAMGFFAVPREPNRGRIEEAARLLNRPVTFTNDASYEVTICAAATSGLTGALAYLEVRQQQRGGFHDITYTLRLRAADGREAAGEPYTYNPFFGCRPHFLEWYGDTALMIYDEKHSLCVCRLGFDSPIDSHKLMPSYGLWALDGYELGFRRYRSDQVQRMRVPDLVDLPAVPVEEWNARGSVLNDH